MLPDRGPQDIHNQAPTPRQLEVLRAIARLTAPRGLPPTLRELGNSLGIKSTNGVADHLSALEKRGLIERDPLLSRALFITDAGFAALREQ